MMCTYMRGVSNNVCTNMGDIVNDVHYRRKRSLRAHREDRRRQRRQGRGELHVTHALRRAALDLAHGRADTGQPKQRRANLEDDVSLDPTLKLRGIDRFTLVRTKR